MYPKKSVIRRHLIFPSQDIYKWMLIRGPSKHDDPKYSGKEGCKNF